MVDHPAKYRKSVTKSWMQNIGIKIETEKTHSSPLLTITFYYYTAVITFVCYIQYGMSMMGGMSVAR